MTKKSTIISCSKATLLKAKCCTFTLLILSLLTKDLQSNSFTSTQNGPWSLAATWGGTGVPGSGDVVVINNDIILDINVIIGSSPIQNFPNPAILITAGKLTLNTGTVLTCRGDIKLNPGYLTMEAGSTLELDASQAIKPDSTVYQLIISPTVGNNALLRVRGTSTQHCQIRSHNGAAPAQITDGNVPLGGRIIADYCDFYGLNDQVTLRAWKYYPEINIDTIKITNCIWDRCGVIRGHNGNLGISPPGSYVDFTRCVWKNSKIDSLEGWYGTLILSSDFGTTAILRNCDFDKSVGFIMAQDYIIEDNVFREGTYNYNYAGLNSIWKSFKRNLVRFTDDADHFNCKYGFTMEDCIMIRDPADKNSSNPHWSSIAGGHGATTIRGCVYWYNAGLLGCEGDANIIQYPDTGTTASENTILIERNIYLPNLRGPEANTQTMSASGFSTLVCSLNVVQVMFKRNTIYSGIYGGANIVETYSIVPNFITYLKSNLFLGGKSNDGHKFSTATPAVTVADVMLAANADYNGGYRLEDCSAYIPGVAGKGYQDIKFTGSNTIGAHDIDDTDPQFVDNTRTPLTWDIYTGGSGTMQSVMDKLSPIGGHAVQELLNYIREGFKPQNNAYSKAGDPLDGSPDIGAVDMNFSVGIPDKKNKNFEVSLSPNPAKNNITITINKSVGVSDKISFTLMNALGQEIIHEVTQVTQHTLDISSLTSGLYLLKVNVNGNISQKKLIID